MAGTAEGLQRRLWSTRDQATQLDTLWSVFRPLLQLSAWKLLLCQASDSRRLGAPGRACLLAVYKLWTHHSPLAAQHLFQAPIRSTYSMLHSSSWHGSHALFLLMQGSWRPHTLPCFSNCFCMRCSSSSSLILCCAGVGFSLRSSALVAMLYEYLPATDSWPMHQVQQMSQPQHLLGIGCTVEPQSNCTASTLLTRSNHRVVRLHSENASKHCNRASRTCGWSLCNFLQDRDAVSNRSH